MKSINLKMFVENIIEISEEMGIKNLDGVYNCEMYLNEWEFEVTIWDGGFRVDNFYEWDFGFSQNEAIRCTFDLAEAIKKEYGKDFFEKNEITLFFFF